MGGHSDDGPFFPMGDEIAIEEFPKIFTSREMKMREEELQEKMLESFQVPPELFEEEKEEVPEENLEQEINALRLQLDKMEKLIKEKG